MTLRSIPPRVRFWRNVRRTALVCVILLLLGGGYSVFQYVDWYPYAPTPVLLLCAETSLGEPPCELLARFDAGELTVEQGERFAAAIQPFELKIDSPWPVSVPPRCELRQVIMPTPAKLTGRTPTLLGLPPIGPMEVWLDGKLITTHEVSPLALSSMVPPRALGDLIREQLPVGEHDVEFVHVLRRSSTTSPLGNRGAMELRLPAAARVVIENRPPAAFMDGAWTENLSACVRERLSARVLSGREETPILALRSSGMPVALCAELWARPAGRGEYVLANENYSSDPLLLHPGAHVEKLRLLPRSVGESVEAIDVRLVPDQATIGQAMLGGQTRYFRGTIEWESLALGAAEGVAPTGCEELAAEDIRYARPVDE